MEFHVPLDGLNAEARRLESALLDEDPAAVFDLDERDGLLRISTWLPAGHLLDVLAVAGCAVEAGRVRQLPSTCCGGCSG